MASDQRISYIVKVWETAHDNVTHWLHHITPSGGCLLDRVLGQPAEGTANEPGQRHYSATMARHHQVCFSSQSFVPQEKISWAWEPRVPSGSGPPLLSLPVTHRWTLSPHSLVSAMLEALVPKGVHFFQGI